MGVDRDGGRVLRRPRPRTDAREADLRPGQKWTGWHRIEKDLWPARDLSYRPLGDTERETYGADLLRNITAIHHQIPGLEFTTDQIANGSAGLMEEVATSKVTGEEEYWSRTDLWDFRANLEGAHTAFQLVRPVLHERDPALERKLAERFTTLQSLLDQHRVGDGFVSYDRLTAAGVKRLADAVSALSEPLSHLTAAVLP
ncbi:MAG: imelysin family protein [Nocardioides sp.]